MGATLADSHHRRREDAVAGSTQTTNMRAIYHHPTAVSHNSSNTKTSTRSANTKKPTLPIFRNASSNKNDSYSRCALTYCFLLNHQLVATLALVSTIPPPSTAATLTLLPEAMARAVTFHRPVPGQDPSNTEFLIHNTRRLLK